MIYVLYALAAVGAYTVVRSIRDEFKPKPSYSPLFRLFDRPVSRPDRTSHLTTPQESEAVK
jgi:hypothetical protein